jgi:hypothetical protein
MADIHRSVLAPQDPVPESHRPAKDGHIVMLPVAKREEAFGQKFLQKLQEIKAPLADDVSDKTVGIIWQDPSPQHIDVLEKTLRDNKQIQWIQVGLLQALSHIKRTSTDTDCFASIRIATDGRRQRLLQSHQVRHWQGPLMDICQGACRESTLLSLQERY